MDIPFINIDVGKKVVPHKAMVTLGVLGIESEVFIHIKSDNMGKRKAALFVYPDKFPVHAEGA
jgi:hypothetical protein